MFCGLPPCFRGWFYTLLVLSTALFNRPPFKNLVCAYVLVNLIIVKLKEFKALEKNISNNTVKAS